MLKIFKNFAIILFLFLLTAGIIWAINDVSSVGPTNFELLTSDTALLSTIVESSGGVVSYFNVQSNYIDITIDDGSDVAFTTDGTVFLKITKISGGANYTLTPNCPTTTVRMQGTVGAAVTLRLEITSLEPSCATVQHYGAIFPTNYSIEINDGAVCTQSNEVSVNLQATNAVQVVLSERYDFIGTEWGVFASPEQKKVILSSGNGQKAIYALFKSPDGNLSTIISKSIIVNSAGCQPAQPVEIPPSTGTSETPSSPSAGTGVCSFDCSLLKYDLYLENSKGIQMYASSGYGQEVKDSDGSNIFNFRDSKTLPVYNDVSVKVADSDCTAIKFNVLSVNSDNHHKVGINLSYAGSQVNGILVFADDHQATDFVTIKASDYFEACSKNVILKSGDLLKGKADTVYYYGKDKKRYVFPNVGTFKSWYNNFNSVKKLSDAQLSTITLGSNVTYKPGVKMIKLNTINDVYAVEAHGVLRWITNESAAAALYGTDWQKKIDDLNDAFYVDYKKGAPIRTSADFNPTQTATEAIDINTDKRI